MLTQTRERNKSIPHSTVKGTAENFAVTRWGDINKRTVNGSSPSKTANAKWYREKGIRLEMSRDEFIEWVLAQRVKIESIYAAGEVPSIDRINSYGHYALSNLQIITYSENRSKRERTPWRDPATGEKRNNIGLQCLTCKKLLTRTVFKSGILESYTRHKTRRFCSSSCAMKGNKHGFKPTFR